MSASQVPEHVPRRGVKNSRSLLVVGSIELLGGDGVQ